MSTFTYTDPDISDARTLYTCLLAEGVSDAIVSLNGELKIYTETAGQDECDRAVAAAAVGTLESNRAARLKELSEKSAEISALGVPFGDDFFPIDQTRFDFSYYQSLVSTTERRPSVLPFSLETVGRGITVLPTLQAVTDLADAATDRLRYIYLEQQNADLSFGEIGYIIAIKTATSQAELDAIIDTRA